MEERREPSLLCRVRHDVLCALPLEHVVEVMRPLAIKPMAGVPSFVCGLAVVRNVPTPVVDAASLLFGEAAHATRFVRLKTGSGPIVLAVADVLGVVEIPSQAVDALPQLIRNAGSDVTLDAIAATGVLNDELLLVLRSMRLISDEVWIAIHACDSAA